MNVNINFELDLDQETLDKISDQINIKEFLKIIPNRVRLVYSLENGEATILGIQLDQ